ncbi:MAG: hypothetical protein ACFE9J_06715 [Candidatus Hermodarchaeota archaeon]
MRTNIFVLTEDLNFFYRLNKELQRLQIKFEVLNIRTIIPDIPGSIILTTLKELNNFENLDRIKCKILPYTKEEDFEQYIVKILAIKKIGNKSYSELVFSIDPGTKYLGLVIFLDDYYLNSHTIFERDRFIEKVKVYVNALQEANPIPIQLVFKFGRGTMPITLNLIEQLFRTFKKDLFRILLIDESKTSKYRIRDIYRKKIPKDEAAALIISLRDGYEITYENYKTALKQKKSNRKQSEESHDKSKENENEFDLKVIQIAESILKGDLSLSKSIDILKTEKINY